MMQPTLREILEAQERLKSSCIRTPLVPYPGDLDLETGTKVYLKLESLQPTGSFKHRGSSNAIRCLPEKLRSEGVVTASAGNFGQGLAWNARHLNVPCAVVVPETVPQKKLNALLKYGASVHKVSYDEWWSTMMNRKVTGGDISGQFIHPVCERSVLAGNATIGLEILEDLPEVDAVIAPFGGGGLSCGVSSAMAAKGRTDVKVFACEVDVASPLSDSLAVGKPSQAERHEATFADGMGGKAVFPEMWPMASQLTGVFKVSLQEIVSSVQRLVSVGLVAEGAGAAPLVPALDGRAGEGNIVCVISGRNLDKEKLITALNGDIPKP